MWFNLFKKKKTADEEASDRRVEPQVGEAGREPADEVPPALPVDDPAEPGLRLPEKDASADEAPWTAGPAAVDQVAGDPPSLKPADGGPVGIKAPARDASSVASAPASPSVSDSTAAGSAGAAGVAGVGMAAASLGATAASGNARQGARVDAPAGSARRSTPQPGGFAAAPDDADDALPPIRSMPSRPRPAPVSDEDATLREPVFEDPVPREMTVRNLNAAEPEKAARPAESEAVSVARQKLRHRLIGASVLVMIGICVSPFFIDDEARIPTVPVDTAIPDKNEPGLAPLDPVANAIEAKAAQDDKDARDAAKEAAKTDAKADAKQDAKPDAKSSAKEAPKAAEKPAKVPAAKTSGADNRLTAKLEPPKVESSSDTLGDMIAMQMKKHDLQEAPKAAARAERTTPVPPVQPEAKQVKGWFIQVAATSSEFKADDMISRLKTKFSLPAYKERLETSGATLWRVRVGPFRTQAEANKAVPKVKATRLVADPKVLQAR